MADICTPILYFSFILLIVIGSIYWAVLFNSLILLKNNVRKAWANIDVLLKQRSDLIPNLVETVKGYMKYEKGLFEEITKARTALMQASGAAQTAKASKQMDSALKTLFAVAENYPQLRASENFLHLQKQLSDLENQIANRREFYNDSVNLYNMGIERFPELFVAKLLGMKREEYFTAEESAKALPSAAM